MNLRAKIDGSAQFVFLRTQFNFVLCFNHVIKNYKLCHNVFMLVILPSYRTYRICRVLLFLMILSEI